MTEVTRHCSLSPAKHLDQAVLPCVVMVLVWADSPLHRGYGVKVFGPVLSSFQFDDGDNATV